MKKMLVLKNGEYCFDFDRINYIIKSKDESGFDLSLRLEDDPDKIFNLTGVTENEIKKNVSDKLIGI